MAQKLYSKNFLADSTGSVTIQYFELPQTAGNLAQVENANEDPGLGATASTPSGSGSAPPAEGSSAFHNNEHQQSRSAPEINASASADPYASASSLSNTPAKPTAMRYSTAKMHDIAATCRGQAPSSSVLASIQKFHCMRIRELESAQSKYVDVVENLSTRIRRLETSQARQTTQDDQISDLQREFERLDRQCKGHHTSEAETHLNEPAEAQTRTKNTGPPAPNSLPSEAVDGNRFGSLGNAIEGLRNRRWSSEAHPARLEALIGSLYTVEDEVRQLCLQQYGTHRNRHELQQLAIAGICCLCGERAEHFSVAPCNHRTCYKCALRIRIPFDTSEISEILNYGWERWEGYGCPYCDVPARLLVFTDDATKSYNRFRAGNCWSSDDTMGIMYETKGIREDVEQLLRCTCPHAGCGTVFEDWTSLLSHVRAVHRKFLCEGCVTNQRRFTSEPQILTSEELQLHKNTCLGWRQNETGPWGALDGPRHLHNGGRWYQMGGPTQWRVLER